MTLRAPEPSRDGDFVHLHVHSEFSLLDGLSRITEMTQRVADQGMTALALTDHGSMYGVIPFYAAARQAGIKPIIGVEAYISPRGMTQKEGKVDADYHHMILLAKDDIGYKNLLALTTAAHLDGYYYKPRIDKELLAKHAQGLIGTSACLGGEVLKRLGQGDEQGAAEAADSYRSILGDGNFFIEVQEHGIDDQRRLHPQLVELARRQNIPLVATNDTHYTHPEQYEAHDLLVCIQTASNLDTPGRMRFENNEFYLKPAADMRRLFNNELPDAFDNTLLIAEQCNVSLDFEGLRLPHFEVPDGETEASWLRKECERGLADRYGTVTDEIRHRLDYELGIIDRMGYSAYFLIVADFTRFAREQGIVTTCRGSAPGSIVTYSLGITPVDPLEYGLPFERFLNPDRVTMPDIDIDFQDSRRDEVIEYVTRKYGDDRVAQIITFGTLGAKAAIRDVGRAMGLTYGEADRVAKAVPNELNISLERAVETSPQLRELMAGDDRVDKLITIAKQLEGVSRHASTHAAGIVISRDPLTEIMPLQRATDGKTTMTQFEMHACEALGLLKFDFLGLINLTILAEAVELVRTHRSISLDVDNLPLDDAKTFELLGRGDTMGVFQLEGSGMRRYVKELKPTEVRDLAAMVALFRPGPMANIPAYIRRKHGEEPVTYLHPALEPALKDTYGIFVYQEDIMTAAIAMADYTGPEADNLCYAIRKKKESVLRQHEAKFKAGAKKKGIPPGIVDQVFAAFEPFARYGFNKAHATCYGLIAYQTAYLKANYPIEFMTAVLNGFSGRAEKVAAVIAECRHLGIEVRMPDVQKSFANFAVETDADGVPEAIRFGMAAIKNVGEGAVDAIVAVRDWRSGAGSVRLARRLLPAGRPAHHQSAGHRVAHQGERHGVARHRGVTARGARRRAGERRTPPARRGGRAVHAVRPLRAAGGGGGVGVPRRRGGDTAPGAPALGEGAHRPVPVGAPAGRHRRGAAGVRHRLHRRARRRGGPGQGHAGRDHPLVAPRHHPGRLDHARCHARGPPGIGRGRRLPARLRGDRTVMGRRLGRPRHRTDRPPRRDAAAPVRGRPPVGRRGPDGTGGVRRRAGSAARCGPWRTTLDRAEREWERPRQRQRRRASPGGVGEWFRGAAGCGRARGAGGGGGRRTGGRASSARASSSPPRRHPHPPTRSRSSPRRRPGSQRWPCPSRATSRPTACWERSNR